MGIDNRGGGGERRDVGTKFFDYTNSFQDIEQTIINLPEGALKDSQGKVIGKEECLRAIDNIKHFLKSGGLIIRPLLQFPITGEQGLRAAIVREIIKATEPSLERVNNLDGIISQLEKVILQNNILGPFGGGTIELKDSSGNAINVQRCIDDLKYIKDWMAYNQGKPVDDSFYMRFTGNYGLRAAVMRATGR